MVQEKTEEQQNYDSVKALLEKRNQLAKREKRTGDCHMGFLLLSLGLMFGFPLILIILMLALRNYYDLYGSWAGLSFGYGVVALIGALWLRSIHHTCKDEIEDLEFKIDLEELGGISTMEMKHLRNNELQLRRYYDQNLGQNDRLFYLGIFCIVLGMGVIGATFYLVLKVADSVDAQIVTGTIGGIGALMTNFIAAIYLRMHGSTAANLALFHSKLVDTHRVLLANLAASRIENTDKREETLKQVAIALSRE